MIDWLRKEMLEPEIELESATGTRTLPIVLRRHPRARRMTLRLAPDGSEARVSLPQWASSREAIEFAQSRQTWLEGQLAKIPQDAAPMPGGTLLYRGEVMQINWDATAPRKPQFDDGMVTLGGPQSSLLPRLQKALEARALDLFEDDRDHYCAAAGLDAAPVKLSRAQRRWGSCSSKKALRINWRLIQAPDYVRRSVVAHEVTHLVHFDHSPAFHAMLGSLFEGDIRTADAWLKDKGRSLYASFG